jgi:hypothetical protein
VDCAKLRGHLTLCELPSPEEWASGPTLVSSKLDRVQKSTARLSRVTVSVNGRPDVLTMSGVVRYAGQARSLGHPRDVISGFAVSEEPAACLMRSLRQVVQRIGAHAVLSKLGVVLTDDLLHYP